MTKLYIIQADFIPPRKFLLGVVDKKQGFDLIPPPNS